VFFPGGGSGTLSGSQIQSVTSTSFVLVIDFNVQLRGLRDTSQQPRRRSVNTFNFTVQPPPQTPVITSISPASPIATVGNQKRIGVGNNFVSGLTVTVFFPGGGFQGLSAAARFRM